MVAIQRSREFIMAALYLSRCGRPRKGGAPLPPVELRTDEWSRAYAIFYDGLGVGRSLRSFHNSLKATRDQFDSHVASGRRGWRNSDGLPKPLPVRDQQILEKGRDRPNQELWEAVQQFADLAVSTVPLTVLADLRSEDPEEDEQVTVGREGRKKAVISFRRERKSAITSSGSEHSWLRLPGVRLQLRRGLWRVGAWFC